MYLPKILTKFIPSYAICILIAFVIILVENYILSTTVSTEKLNLNYLYILLYAYEAGRISSIRLYAVWEADSIDYHQALNLHDYKFLDDLSILLARFSKVMVLASLYLGFNGSCTLSSCLIGPAVLLADYFTSPDRCDYTRSIMRQFREDCKKCLKENPNRTYL